jgi:hypothetical protein
LAFSAAFFRKIALFQISQKLRPRENAGHLRGIGSFWGMLKRKKGAKKFSAPCFF